MMAVKPLGLCDFAKFLLDRHLVWFHNQAEPFATWYMWDCC